MADGWQGSTDKAKFTGGYVQWTDSDGIRHSRTIIEATAGETSGVDTIHIQGTTEGMETTTDITFFAGCNHLIEDCRNLHNNINNFGGQWRIPLANPVGYVNRYY